MVGRLDLIIRCADCGEEVDTWALSVDDPATHVCEIASDLNFEHECKKREEDIHALPHTPPTECPQCKRVMSAREAEEQKICSDCREGQTGHGRY